MCFYVIFGRVAKKTIDHWPVPKVPKNCSGPWQESAITTISVTQQITVSRHGHVLEPRIKISGQDQSFEPLANVSNTRLKNVAAWKLPLPKSPRAIQKNQLSNIQPLNFRWLGDFKNRHQNCNFSWYSCLKRIQMPRCFSFLHFIPCFSQREELHLFVALVKDPSEP